MAHNHDISGVDGGEEVWHLGQVHRSGPHLLGLVGLWLAPGSGEPEAIGTWGGAGRQKLREGLSILVCSALTSLPSGAPLPAPALYRRNHWIADEAICLEKEMQRSHGVSFPEMVVSLRHLGRVCVNPAGLAFVKIKDLQCWTQRFLWNPIQSKRNHIYGFPETSD